MTISPLHIALLGSPTITIGQKSLQVDRRKAIALLAYLSVTGQPHQREMLATLFWPEHGQKRALANLRQTIWVLKKALGKKWLRTERDTIGLRAGYDLDVHRFRQKIEAGQSDPEELETAVSLYRGSFMAGFTLADSPQFEEWHYFQSQHYQQLLVDALQRLIKQYAERDVWEKAIQYTQQWLVLDPLHEPAHVGLMKLYLQTGRRSKALQQYERLEAILAEELQTQPQADTQAFYQQLLQGETEAFVPVAVSAASITADNPPPPGSLPPGSRFLFKPNRLFVGRQPELRQLAVWLKVDEPTTDVPIVSISGLSGVGKTQLAVEFAYRYGRYFPGGVFWLSFAQRDAVAVEIESCGSGEALALHPHYDKLNQAEQLKLVQQAWQESVPRLLIFDNCEEEDLLEQWRPIVGGCRVLVTSRRNYWMPTLSVTNLELNPLAAADSVALLQLFLPQIKEHEARAVATELGHLPLALHLAGNFLNRYQHIITPANYLSQLQDKQLLAHPSLQGTGVHQSPTAHEEHVGQTFALCYERLDLSRNRDVWAQKLLACATLFAPGNPIPRKVLLATLLDPEMALVSESDVGLEATLRAEDALRRLAVLGLLTEDTERNVVLHRLVRLFVQGVVTDKQQAQRAVESVVFRQARAQNATGYPAAVAAWRVHLRHVVTVAWERADEMTARLAHELAAHLHQTGDFAEARPFHEHALAIRQQYFGSQHPETAESLHNLGYLLHEMGDYEAACVLYEKALAVREVVLGETHPETAQTLAHLGHLFQSMGQLDKSRQNFERTLAIYEAEFGRQHPETAHSLNGLANVLRQMGHLTEAKKYHQQALTVRQAVLTPDHPDTAQSLNNLGEVLGMMGEYQAAWPYYEACLAIREKVFGQDHFNLASVLSNMGYLHYMLGDYAQAQSYYRRTLVIDENSSGPEHPNTAHSLHNLGQLLIAIGDFDQAKIYLERALVIREAALGRRHPHTARTLSSLGELARVQGQVGEAVRHHKRALALLTNALDTDHMYAATCMHSLAVALREAGRWSAARPFIEQALKVRQESLGERHPETAVTLAQKGMVLLAAGETTNAKTCLEKALAIQRDRLGQLHPHVGETLSFLGQVHLAVGETAQAKRCFRQASAILRQTLGATHPQTKAVARQFSKGINFPTLMAAAT